VLEGFYESGAQDLMGLRSDGTLYQYMVPTEQGPLSLSQLAPDAIGEGVLSFGATGAAVINPLTFSALPVAGGTAALAVGASNGGKALSAQELALQQALACRPSPCRARTARPSAPLWAVR
jgi:hypothetical protein